MKKNIKICTINRNFKKFITLIIFSLLLISLPFLVLQNPNVSKLKPSPKLETYGIQQNNLETHIIKKLHRGTSAGENTEYKHEMCLIAAWEGQSLVPYHKLSLKTANYYKNSKIKVIFLHEGIPKADLDKYPNVRFIEVSKGFYDLMARKICEFYHQDQDSALCQDLAKALKDAKNRHQGSPSAQYRGALGLALEDVILKEEKCKSWAYVDHDMFYGDVEGFINNNEKFWESDVVSFGATNSDAVYTAAQFTAHIQTKRPKFVNRLFANCPAMGSAENFKNTFSNNFYGLDEGCYSYGVFKTKNVTWTKFAYQTSENSCGCDYILWISGHIFKLKKSDLKNIKQIINPSVLASYNLPKTNEWDKHFEDRTISAPLKFERICGYWISEPYNVCTNYEDTKSENSEWLLDTAVVRIQNSKANYISMAKKISNFNPREYAVFHMDGWKHGINFSEFDDSKDIFLAKLHGNGSAISFNNLDEIEERFS